MMTEFSHTIKIYPGKGRSIEHLNALSLIDFYKALFTSLYGTIEGLDHCLYQEEIVGSKRNAAVVIDVDLSGIDFATTVMEIRNLFSQFPFSIISHMEITENKLPIPRGEDLLSKI